MAAIQATSLISDSAQYQTPKISDCRTINAYFPLTDISTKDQN